jgi:Uma2 family endonuclease
MCTVVIQYPEELIIPGWIADLSSFHRWTASEDTPEHLRIDYLKGEIWIDLGEEPLFSHNQVCAAFSMVLGGLAKSTRVGRYFTRGVRVSHPTADWSVVPDAIWISNASFLNKCVRLNPGAAGDYDRIDGTPDMVLEIVSDSSVDKDTDRLRELYWKAGIPEYWLVDARKEPLAFDILRRTAKGYVTTRKQAGWLKSEVFGKSFRLVQEADALGHPAFTLEVR